MKQEEQEGTEQTCNSCKYTWTYKGTQEYYATCPNCRNKVRIKKKIIQQRQNKTGIEPIY